MYKYFKFENKLEIDVFDRMRILKKDLEENKKQFRQIKIVSKHAG